MSQVQAIRLYQNEQFVGNCAVLSAINCALVTGPKQGYLKQGKGYMAFELVFEKPKEGPYISGVFMSEDGRYVMIDGTIEDFVAKCNACCGDDAVITPVYDGVYPDLELEPLLREVTVQIKDNGQAYDNDQALYKYQKYIYSNFYRSSRNNGTGVTTYKFSTYKLDVPPMLGPDNVTPDIVAYTTTNYDSNTPGNLTTGQHYSVVLNVNGNNVGVPTPFVGAVDADLTAVATALNANSSYAYFGTFSVSSGKIRLASYKAITATINVTKS